MTTITAKGRCLSQMDISEIKSLLQKICVTYPANEKHWFEADGKLKRAVGDEWYRCIGFMDLDECMKLYDEYLSLPDGNHYAPDLRYFKSRGKKTREVEKHMWKAPQFQHRWYVVYGRWYDENLCEYDVEPHTSEDRYKVDNYHQLYRGIRPVTIDGRAILATACRNYDEVLSLEAEREHTNGSDTTK